MKNSAFTLIELLVVIVIIGILATLTTATFSGSREKADEAKVIAERRDACIESIGACTALGNSDCETFDECMTDLVVISLPAPLDVNCVADTNKIDDGQYCSNCIATGGLYSNQSPGCLCAPGYTMNIGPDSIFGECMSEATCSSLSGATCYPYPTYYPSAYVDMASWLNFVNSSCTSAGGTMTGGVCLN